MAKKETAQVLSIDGRDVCITNPDKALLLSRVELSKLDVVKH